MLSPLADKDTRPVTDHVVIILNTAPLLYYISVWTLVVKGYGIPLILVANTPANVLAQISVCLLP